MDGKKHPGYDHEFIHDALAQLDTTLRRLNMQGLCLDEVLSNIVLKSPIRFLDEYERICNEYRELLLEFLENPARAGQHALNGERFATAAFYCLQHVSIDHGVVRYTTFLCATAYMPRSITFVCRPAERETLQMALIYIRLMLPRSSKSEELLSLAKNYTLSRDCTRYVPSYI